MSKDCPSVTVVLGVNCGTPEDKLDEDTTFDFSVKPLKRPKGWDEASKSFRIVVPSETTEDTGDENVVDALASHLAGELNALLAGTGVTVTASAGDEIPPGENRAGLPVAKLVFECATEVDSAWDYSKIVGFTWGKPGYAPPPPPPSPFNMGEAKGPHVPYKGPVFGPHHPLRFRGPRIPAAPLNAGRSKRPPRGLPWPKPTSGKWPGWGPKPPHELPEPDSDGEPTEPRPADTPDDGKKHPPGHPGGKAEPKRPQLPSTDPKAKKGWEDQRWKELVLGLCFGPHLGAGFPSEPSGWVYSRFVFGEDASATEISEFVAENWDPESLRPPFHEDAPLIGLVYAVRASLGVKPGSMHLTLSIDPPYIQPVLAGTSLLSGHIVRDSSLPAPGEPACCPCESCEARTPDDRAAAHPLFVGPNRKPPALPSIEPRADLLRGQDQGEAAWDR